MIDFSDSLNFENIMIISFVLLYHTQAKKKMLLYNLRPFTDTNSVICKMIVGHVPTTTVIARSAATWQSQVCSLVLEIATPVCALVRNDNEGRLCHQVS